MPLSELTGSEDIHGVLDIVVQGRSLPPLGYWGMDDACFADWVTELPAMVRELGTSMNGRFSHDPGDQGEPEYRFERAGDSATLTIVEENGEGDVYLNWDQVEFRWDDAVGAVTRFLAELRALLGAEAGEIGTAWVDRVSGVSGLD
ncbi:MAG: hypothetical protein ACFCVC_01060 [Acidimicrobiia bacterium]